MAVQDALRERIREITNLPTLPQIAARLMKIVNDPITSAGDVAFLIGQDLSLSAKVLRLANSAFYGIPRTITNLNNAVVVLGLRVINTMVLSLTVFDLFPQDRVKPLFDRRAFWRHSLGCATIAKLLAGRPRKFVMYDPEEAFCAGLLHDVGKVVMEQYLHDDFRCALALAQAKKLPLHVAEMERLGYTHTNVAEWLTSGWDLPVELQAPLVYHHAPTHPSFCADAIALCHYADYLCYDVGLVVDTTAVPPTLDSQTVDTLKIEPLDVERVKNQLQKELEKMEAFIDIVVNR